MQAPIFENSTINWLQKKKNNKINKLTLLQEYIMLFEQLKPVNGSLSDF